MKGQESLRDRLRTWVREHPAEAAFVGVLTVAVLLYVYERWRWRLVRPR